MFVLVFVLSKIRIHGCYDGIIPISSTRVYILQHCDTAGHASTGIDFRMTASPVGFHMALEER
jgi:hypothetical protein